MTDEKGKTKESEKTDDEVELSTEDVLLIRETWKQVRSVMDSNDNEFDCTISILSLA